MFELFLEIHKHIFKFCLNAEPIRVGSTLDYIQSKLTVFTLVKLTF